MKRTKDKDSIRWTHTGGGSFVALINGRKKMIKPGQLFSAKLEEIPMNFRDIIVPADGAELKAAETVFETVDVAKLEYTISPRGGNWFDVLDSNGKQVNEKSLRKDAAEELISSLK